MATKYKMVPFDNWSCQEVKSDETELRFLVCNLAVSLRDAMQRAQPYYQKPSALDPKSSHVDQLLDSTIPFDIRFCGK